MADTDTQVYAEIVLRSRSGMSLLADRQQLSFHTLSQFGGHKDEAAELRDKLEKEGFKVLAATRYGLSISGSEGLYSKFFSTNVAQRPVEMQLGKKRLYRAKSFFLEEAPRIPSDISGLAESVYVPPIGTFYAGEGAMPTPGYYHLRPPTDIVQLTNADAAHARGFTGSSVRVAMVDSGFVEDHDYYTGKGYNISVMAAVGSTTADEVGHGTGIASNLLAVAPDADFLFVKMFDGVNWASRAGFVMAVDNGARVITNSWGQQYDALLAADILDAVTSGITVIFACGNGGSVGWPGCMEEVISVGGAYPREDGTWEASSYASSGVNGLVPGRHCPDLSAIVGQAPHGIFIVMPTQAGAEFDGSFSGGVFPNGDETGAADGWLVASGTSSAAPMVAGAATLLLEADTTLTPAEIRQALEDTCLDVVDGSSANGEIAGIGPDSPTGAGMIDIGAAVNEVAPPIGCSLAPLQCLRAPVYCKVGPTGCVRAPLQCKTAPLQCKTAPLMCKTAPQQCVRAPLQCKTAPIVCKTAPQQCVRAPLECSKAPIVDCRTAPSVCAKAPIVECRAAPQPVCLRAPIELCRLAPAYRECMGGPVRKPDIPGIPERKRMVPVVIMVDESEVSTLVAETGAIPLDDSAMHRLAMEAAEEAYYATLEQLGVEGEFDDFPKVGSCRRAPFDPQAES